MSGSLRPRPLVVSKRRPPRAGRQDRQHDQRRAQSDDEEPHDHPSIAAITKRAEADRASAFKVLSQRDETNMLPIVNNNTAAAWTGVTASSPLASRSGRAKASTNDIVSATAVLTANWRHIATGNRTCHSNVPM